MLEVKAAGTLLVVVIVDGMTVVLGIVITEVPAEVVVVLAVIVADAARAVILPDIVIAEKVSAALLGLMAPGTSVVIVDGTTVVTGIVICRSCSGVSGNCSRTVVLPGHSIGG